LAIIKYMKLNVLILIIALALTLPIKGTCQCFTTNFIKNPGLEDYTCCPTNYAMIACANYWTQPLPSSTSDYYNTCGISSVVSPTVGLFFQYAHFGNGYAGICCDYYPGNVTPPFQYREYLQAELAESLSAGQCYYCEFWVRPFNNYDMAETFSAIDAIGIYFSDTLIKIDHPTNPLFLTAQINNPAGRIIADTTAWTQINGTFIADGGEKFLTIGTFVADSEINRSYYHYIPDYSNAAYYFFDNFSLCPCDDTIPPKPEIVYVPNIFSPNGDGNNDVLYVRSLHIKELKFSVYNRWGEKVFESQNKNEGWDGNYKGQPCSPDVYVYHVAIVFEDGTEESRKGNVTLVR